MHKHEGLHTVTLSQRCEIPWRCMALLPKLCGPHLTPALLVLMAMIKLIKFTTTS